MMESRIELLEQKLLVGVHRTMSLSENSTAGLWQQFMPRRGEVKNRTSSDHISMQVYGQDQDNLFNPTSLFEKWATVEVSTHKGAPRGMGKYTLGGGDYAVFIHIGPVSAAPKAMQYIFEEWLPDSEYEVDSREHFEILPEDYDPFDLNAREEVWVPIRKR